MHVIGIATAPQLIEAARSGDDGEMNPALVALGVRLRSLRSRRGVTRKEPCTEWVTSTLALDATFNALRDVARGAIDP